MPIHKNDYVYNKMYSIALTNGKIINIKADEIEWCEKTRMIKIINNGLIVARINMDNVVGWINEDYKVESEHSLEKENEIDDTFNKLLSLDNHHLEVSKDVNGNICVGYKDAWIDDVYCFKGVVGRGKTLAEAANNYCKLISGQTIVFLNENNREEVKVLF